MYRGPVESTPQQRHEADRGPTDLYGEPAPRAKAAAARRPPARHMHRRPDWEDQGGWDDDELDGLGPDGVPTPRPEPDLGGCLLPEAGPVTEVTVSERAAVTLDAAAIEAAVRAAKVAAFAARHASKSPIHVPGDHARPVDYAGGVTALLREMARLQLHDRSPIRPPVVETDRAAARPRFRLRWWKADAKARKGGKWTNLGSYRTREAAEAARLAWMREHGADTRLDLPAYLMECVPGAAASNAVGAARGDGFFAA